MSEGFDNMVDVAGVAIVGGLTAMMVNKMMEPYNSERKIRRPKRNVSHVKRASTRRKDTDFGDFRNVGW
jgi:hypothetical protein